MDLLSRGRYNQIIIFPPIIWTAIAFTSVMNNSTRTSYQKTKYQLLISTAEASVPTITYYYIKEYLRTFPRTFSIITVSET